MKYSKYFVVLLIVFAVSCSRSSEQIEDASRYVYETPGNIGDGLEVSSLDTEGIDSEKIVNLHKLIIYGDFGDVHSLLIMKNGKLVFEEYYRNYSRESREKIYSVSKSVTSALIGIAIEKDFIKSVDDKLYDFFPEYSNLRNDNKMKILLKHVLTMSAGLDWDEKTYPTTHRENDFGEMIRNGNWILYVLARDMKTTPGTEFVYNTGLSVLLAGIIKNTTGSHADVFAENNLFIKLGITNYTWEKQDDGLPAAGSGLAMRPRDMMKFGYLYCNNGIWNNEQILSSSWITETFTNFVEAELENSYGFTTGYGYQWWNHSGSFKGTDINSFSAQGYGGQYIIIFPELELVLILTQANNLIQDKTLEIIYEHILPAIL